MGTGRGRGPPRSHPGGRYGPNGGFEGRRPMHAGRGFPGERRYEQQPLQLPQDLVPVRMANGQTVFVPPPEPPRMAYAPPQQFPGGIPPWARPQQQAQPDFYPQQGYGFEPPPMAGGYGPPYQGHPGPQMGPAEGYQEGYRQEGYHPPPPPMAAASQAFPTPPPPPLPADDGPASPPAAVTEPVAAPPLPKQDAAHPSGDGTEPGEVVDKNAAGSRGNGMEEDRPVEKVEEPTEMAKSAVPLSFGFSKRPMALQKNPNLFRQLAKNRPNSAAAAAPSGAEQNVPVPETTAAPKADQTRVHSEAAGVSKREEVQQPASPTEPNEPTEPASPTEVPQQPSEKPQPVPEPGLHNAKDRRREKWRNKQQAEGLDKPPPVKAAEPRRKATRSRSRSRRTTSRSSSSSGRSSRSVSSSPGSLRRVFTPPPAPRREADGPRHESPRHGSPARDSARDRPGLERRHISDRYRRRSPSHDRHRSRYRSPYRRSPRHSDVGRARDRDRYRRSPSPAKRRRSPSPARRTRRRFESHSPERRKRHRSRREDTEPPEEGEVGPAPKPKPKVPKMNPLPAAPKPAVQPVDVEMEIDEEEPPPLPTDADGRLELAKEVAAFSQQTQAALDKLFARYDLNRSAAQDYAARADLAGRLYDRMTCAGSDKLQLEFVADLADEQSDPGPDDLSCLGDPEVWGFPSWLPPPLASLDLAPAVVDAPEWEMRDTCASIPWSPIGEVKDPRPAPAAAPKPIKLPLPPFAFMQPKQAEQAESDGLSWSQNPPLDVRDDAESRGPPEALGLVPPPPPPPPSMPPPMTQQAAAAVTLPVPAANPEPATEQQQPRRHTVEPEESSNWTYVTNRGSFSSHPTTLGRLRRHARDAKRGLVLGASVFRERDNMWLPLREGDDIRLRDLEWQGAPYAAEISRERPEAEAADRDWFANASVPNRDPAADSTRPAEPLSEGPDMVAEMSDAEVVAWAEGAFSAHTSLLRTTMRAWFSNRLVPEGAKEWVPGTWGPPPPPHVAAMLAGRLALRVLGGKEGETLAAKLIEESFEAVMAKEPERQAKLAAEREEADRAKRQAELRRQAEERKRQEDRRKQMKAEAARDEQRRAERRREQERRSTHHRDHNRRSHERDRHRERDWRHDDRRRRDGSKSREGSEKPKLEARPEPEAQKPVDKSRTPAAEAPGEEDGQDEDFVPGSSQKKHKASKRSRSKSVAQEAEPQEQPASPSPPEEDEGIPQAKREQIRARLLKRAVPEAIKDVWNALRKYDRDHLSTIFADPVDRKMFPTYDQVVERPMDLRTLGKKLHAFEGSMEGMSAFKAEVELISDNALKFAGELQDADLKSAAEDLRKEFLKLYVRKMGELEADLFF